MSISAPRDRCRPRVRPWFGLLNNVCWCKSTAGLVDLKCSPCGCDTADRIIRTLMPPAKVHYGDAVYWNRRYDKSTAEFEWYESYQPLRDLLHDFASKDQPILQIGVGTSKLQLDMLNDGYQHIVNQDISASVIQHMVELHQQHAGLSYAVGDCRDMPEYRDSSFGTVLDKGTIDSLLCDDGGAAQAANALRECSRVLKPGGHYIMMTYASPMHRIGHLSQDCLSWDIQILTLQQSTPGNGGSKYQNLIPPPPPRELPHSPEPAHQQTQTDSPPAEVKAAGSKRSSIDQQRHGRGYIRIPPGEAASIKGEEGHFIYVCTKQMPGTSHCSSSSGLDLQAPFDARYNKRRLLSLDGHSSDDDL